MQRVNNTVYLGVKDLTTGADFITTATIPRFSGRKKRVSSNITYKRWRGTTATLDELVLRTAEQLVSQRQRGYNASFSAEAIAYMMKIKVDQIRHSLHRLNLVGKVSQRYKHCAEGTNRAWFHYGNDSGWAANRYTLWFNG